MKINGIENLIKYPNLLEGYIVKICNRNYVDLEFRNEYEPEIKLKLMFDYFSLNSKDLYDKNPGRYYQEYFVETLFGILKRFDCRDSNYDIFYHVLLSLELIKPQDINNILRLLIHERKFFILQSDNYKINLQIKLLSIYLDNVTGSENINFIKEFLLSEFELNKYNAFPVFDTIFLRYFIRFGSDSNFFSVLEDLIRRKSTKLNLFQFSISIEEFLRIKMSYESFYLWLRNVIRQNLEMDAPIFDFINKCVYPIINNLARKKINKIFLLMIAEIGLIDLNERFNNIIESLQEFSNFKSTILLNNISLAKYFAEFILLLELKGYTLSIDRRNQDVHFYKPEYKVFESADEPNIIHLENELYLNLISLKYPKVLTGFEFNHN